MRVSRVLAPVTSLGPGRRAGLWVQGCTLACRGCASVDTWDPAGGTDVEVGVVARELSALVAAHRLDGLTISGGEPFQQADALAALVRALRAAHPQLDVLVFTGYAAKAARRRGPALFDLADVLVAGPYVAARPSSHPLLASANQELVVRTERGRQRLASAATAAGTTHLQVAAFDGDVTVVGLPAPGDLDRLAERLAARGVELGGASWRR